MAINKLFWNKFTTNLAVVFVVFLSIRALIQEFFKKGDEYGSDFLISVPSGATVSEYEANILADQLSDAFDGGFLGLGTNEVLIEKIIDSLSTPNFAVVHNAFGLREYDGASVNNDGTFLLPKTSKARSLIFILDRELGSLDGRLRGKVSDKYKQLGLHFTP